MPETVPGVTTPATVRMMLKAAVPFADSMEPPVIPQLTATSAAESGWTAYRPTTKYMPGLVRGSVELVEWTNVSPPPPGAGLT